MFKKAIFLLFLFVITIHAQKYNFDTHFATLEGELTADDVYESDFGRFDAYELGLQEGDYIKMKLTANFFPFMTIVAPSNEYKLAFPKENKPEVFFEEEVDESGLWHIYIAGDSIDFGEHTLKICYVSHDSRQLPPNSNYCELAEFFLSHSNTDYFYFRNTDCNEDNGKWLIEIETQNLFDSGEITLEDSNPKLVLNIKKRNGVFQEIADELTACLRKEWNIRKGKEKIEFIEIEGLRKVILEQKKKIINLAFIGE